MFLIAVTILQVLALQRWPVPLHVVWICVWWRALCLPQECREISSAIRYWAFMFLHHNFKWSFVFATCIPTVVCSIGFTRYHNIISVNTYLFDIHFVVLWVCVVLLVVCCASLMTSYILLNPPSTHAVLQCSLPELTIYCTHLCGACT